MEQIIGEVVIGFELSSLRVVAVRQIEYARVDSLEQENCDLLGKSARIDVTVFCFAKVVHLGLTSSVSRLVMNTALIFAASRKGLRSLESATDLDGLAIVETQVLDRRENQNRQ